MPLASPTPKIGREGGVSVLFIKKSGTEKSKNLSVPLFSDFFLLFDYMRGPSDQCNIHPKLNIYVAAELKKRNGRCIEI